MNKLRSLLFVLTAAVACDGSISGGSISRTDPSSTYENPDDSAPPDEPPPEQDHDTTYTAGSSSEDPPSPVSEPSSCPDDLVCVAPSGRYRCEKTGPEALPCDSAADCPSSIPSCSALGGQGICLRYCTPEDGFPSETSVGGTVVRYAAGNAWTGTREAPREPTLEGVQVCLEAPVELKDRVGCTTTDAEGKFSLGGLPPNINPAQPIGGVLSFHKDGYVPQRQFFALGDGPQDLAKQVRLLTVTYATGIAEKLGATLPDAQTAWLLVDTVKFDNHKGPYSFKQGSLQLAMLDGVKIATSPAAGNGPFYTNDQELVAARAAADSDAGVAEDDAGAAPDDTGATSRSGFAFFLGVPAREGGGSSYTLTFEHASLDCGTAIAVVLTPGYVTTDVGAVCGHGVK